MRISSARGITRSRVALLALMALSAIGMAACSGSDGKNGATGAAGSPGATGATGPTGPTGPAGNMIASLQPEACQVCHADTGSLHQAHYDEYASSTDGTLTLAFTGVTSAPGAVAGEFDVTLNFTVTKDGAPYVGENGLTSMNQKTFYAVEYDGTARKFLNSKSMPASGVIANGDGTYSLTQTGFTYDPLAPVAPFTGVQVYGYIAQEPIGIDAGNVHLYKYVSNTALVTAGTITYTSAANVAACQNCHGAPYQKHGYRDAVVAGLPDFAACKSCHYDDRSGHDTAWQYMVDQPYNWATGVPIPTPEYPAEDYAYVASVMNDTHMSHAMEFDFPQSMANCATCHEGKLTGVNGVLDDSNFKLETCRSCHPINGTQAWTEPTEQPYAQANRAPALKELWAAGNVGFHDTLDLATVVCSDCHKTGGVASTFSVYHSGYNSMIYDTSTAPVTKYSEQVTASVDTVTFDAATGVMNLKYSATDPAVVPTVMVSFYGWDTKDFYISNHTGDNSKDCISSRTGQPAGCPMEYVYGSDNKLFTPVATSAGTWEVNLDLNAWVPGGSTGVTQTIPELIAAGVLRQAEVAVMPALTVPGPNTDKTNWGPVEVIAALNAPSKTILLSDSSELTDYYKGSEALVDVNGCNKCHDALATTFHTADRGGNIVVCRMCHVVTSGAAHLQVQSRSIDSYAHAIHRNQYLDSQSVDFTDPVYAARYGLYIEGFFPVFTLEYCEACHNTGKFNVPNEAKSMPGMLAAAVGNSTNPLLISDVPTYMTGAGSRACMGCHRGEFFNENLAVDLITANSHTGQMGFMYPSPTTSATDTSTSDVYSVIDQIMGYFYQ
jgi:hypothetical protein